MKNKRLIWTLVFLAILTLGSIGTDLFKKEQQSTHKVAKVGILQFVTHDALDQIEKGIEDGLKEAGYKGGQGSNYPPKCRRGPIEDSNHV